MGKQIRSVQNPFVRELVQLKFKSRNRKKAGQFLIEGSREIDMALKGGYKIETILYRPELVSEDQIEAISDPSMDRIEVSEEVYEKLAYRDSTQGMLAVARSQGHDIGDLTLSSAIPLVLVAEAPEKPGNIGALLRTADAANLDAVIIANPKSDLYNPNIIRSSVGCLFTNTVATGTTTEIISFLKDLGISIYCAALQTSIPYQHQDFTGPTALVVGTESTGLSTEWLENSTQNIIIPMQGKIDSLNVSVTAGILIFEAKRQRNFE
jgi:TrmH family RNA methyltransferase